LRIYDKGLSKMRVVQINAVCGLGSTGRIVVDLYHLLKNEDIESFVAYGRNRAPSGIDAYRISNGIDIALQGALTRVMDAHGLFLKRATNRLIKKIKSFQPDIIHLHNLHGYYLNYEMLFDFLNQYNRPLIWTLHDCWAFTGHCAYFDYVNCNKWQTGCYNCPQKFTYPRSYLLDGSKRNYQRKKISFTSLPTRLVHIITPSKWLGGLVKKSFLKKYTVNVIHNGIDLRSFRPCDTSRIDIRYGLRGKLVLLGVANGWPERKGLKYFLQLAKSISEDMKIVLVGIPHKLLHTLPENILSIEKMKHKEDLSMLYSRADIFINPTVEDNFPTVNLEALACGTPVITFNTGGSSECIFNGCGEIVSKSSEAIRKAIVRRGRKSKYTETLCRKLAKDMYCKEKCFKKYIDLYKNIC